MDINTRTSLVGFLLAVSALSLPAAAANSPTPEIEATPQTVESRLSRLTEAIRERTQQLPETSAFTSDEIALGWGDGRGGRRGWVDTRRGGWLNGNRGGFANRNPWRNGWGDRGGFFNTRPWGNSGSFINRW